MWKMWLSPSVPWCFRLLGVGNGMGLEQHTSSAQKGQIRSIMITRVYACVGAISGSPGQWKHMQLDAQCGQLQHSTSTGLVQFY